MHRLLLPLSLMCLLSVQVLLEVSGDGGRIPQFLGNAIEEVPDTWILTLLDFVLGTNRDELPPVQHRNTVCDPERARHFMGHNDNCHVKGLLQEENEFI